jgi:hypothetical protein
MSTRKIRKNLKTWLESWIRIDDWDLDVPSNVPVELMGRRFPAMTAVAMPLEDLTLFREDSTLVMATARFPYHLIYRFNGTASRHQLPSDEVELIINFLSERASRYPQDISPDISRIEVDRLADPCAIGRVLGEDGDWLILGKLELKISFISEAEKDLESILNILQPKPSEIHEESQEGGPPGAKPGGPIRVETLRLGFNRSKAPSVDPTDPTTFTLDQLLEMRF